MGQQYTGMQSVLNGALGSYRAQGFRLIERADHILELYREDALVGTFSQLGATIPSIRSACCEELHGR